MTPYFGIGIESCGCRQPEDVAGTNAGALAAAYDSPVEGVKRRAAGVDQHGAGHLDSGLGVGHRGKYSSQRQGKKDPHGHGRFLHTALRLHSIGFQKSHLAAWQRATNR